MFIRMTLQSTSGSLLFMLISCCPVYLFLLLVEAQNVLNGQCIHKWLNIPFRGLVIQTLILLL